MKRHTRSEGILSIRNYPSTILKAGCLAFLISLTSITRASEAEIIYNGYGNTTGSYAGDLIYMFGWFDRDMLGVRYEGDKVAFKFTAGDCLGQWSLRELDIAGYYNGEPNIRLSIVMDNGNYPTGAVMCSVTNPPQIQLTMGNATIPISGTLQPGGVYWFVCEPLVKTGSSTNLILGSDWPHTGGTYSYARRNYLTGDWEAWSVGAVDAYRGAFNIKGVSTVVPLITAYQNNSELTWTDGVTNGVYTIEWAPEATGTWHRSWTALTNIAASSATNTVVVPRFFRVIRDRVQTP